MRPGLDHQLASANLLLISQQACFQNDFHRPLVRRFDDVAQFAQHVLVIPVLDSPNIDHDIDLMRASIDRRFRLETFYVGIHRAERKAHHRRNFYLSAVEAISRELHP